MFQGSDTFRPFQASLRLNVQVWSLESPKESVFEMFNGARHHDGGRRD